MKSPLKQRLLQKLYRPYKGRLNVTELFDELDEAEKELDERIKNIVESRIK